MAPPYPTPAQIKQIFDSRVDQSVFNSHLADNISIIIVGHNSPFVGHYKSVQHFDEAVYARMAATLKMETAKVEVVQVIGGGESASAAVESVVTGTSKLDKPYFSEYVDLVRFNAQGKIEQLKMFADHDVSRDHLKEHEGKV